MKMMRYRFVLWMISVFVVGNVWANNLNITNISATTNTITFDIAWENSWYVDRAPNNWDAVWVFVKAQDCNDPDRLWNHADLSINPTHHTAAAPLVVDTVSDGKGVFIRRGALGSGNITATTVTLRLQNTYNLSNISFQVMGIEMVAVLDGAFSIGGYSGSETTSSATTAGHSYPDVLISSEAQIDAGDIRTNGLSPTQYFWGYNPTIPASFPKGYNRFYIMKYEISQEQYLKFLNSLTYAQQTFRTQFTPASAPLTNAFGSNSTTSQNRNGIKVRTTGNVANPAEYGMNLNNNTTFDEAADGHNVACNYLNWTDLLAYLDWSALRPMTELEYEKACRGPFSIFNYEYAWGNANIQSASSGSLNLGGQPGETSTITPSFGNGLAATNSGSGPFRVGFTGNSTSGRISAGVSYWGVFDLTGNVWEQTVCTGYQNGNISGFTGSLGDGTLTIHGDANEPDWDLDPAKSIVRGGAWNISTTYSRVGSRYYIGSTSVTYNGPTRNASTGGRGVRQF